MASSSPYQNNDYQAVSAYRPYRLPVNDIFKGLVAQDQFWKEGAQRVKGVYDNALNLKLSNEENRQIRDNYIKEAEQQLTKLSSMDLTDPSVQRQGINLFKPLFQDRGIVSDDAATKHIEKVNADALSYRTRDGGKGYSPTNHQYALFGAKEFKESKDRFAGEQYLQNRKEYEPFYDPTSELSGILKNCKPDKASGEAIKGMYIAGYSNESLSAAKINTCLDAGLSDRARRQLEINGTVTYKDNPQALRDKYIPHLQGTRTQMAEQKAAIEGILANKDNLKNLKPDQLAKIGIRDIKEITPNLLQSLEETRKGLDTRIGNTSRTIEDLQNNKFDAVSGQNLEKVASVVYSRDYMQNVGEGFSYDFQTNTVKADPVQMMYYKEEQQNARQEDDQSFDRANMEAKFNHEIELENIKAGKGKNGSVLDQLKGGTGASGALDEARITLPATENDPFSAVQKNNSYDQVVMERQRIATERGNTNQWLYKQLTGMGMDPSYKPGSPQWNQYVANFQVGASNDPVKKQILDQFNSRMDGLVALEDLHRGVQQKVDAKVQPLDQKLTQEISNLPPAAVKFKGQTLQITADEVRKALSGQSSILQIQRERMPGTGHQGNIGRTTYGIKLNGVSMQGSVDVPASLELNHLVAEVDNKIGNKARTIAKARNDMMQQETVLQKEVYSLGELNDPKGLQGQLARVAGISANYANNVVVGYTDLNGQVAVTLNKPKKGETDYDYESAKKKLIGKYNGQELADGTLVLKVNSLDMIDENRISSVMKPYIRVLEAKTDNPNEPSSTHFMRSGNGRKYRLDVTTGMNGGYTYKIIDEAAPHAPVALYNDRDEALQNFETVLKRGQPQVSTK